MSGVKKVTDVNGFDDLLIKGIAKRTNDGKPLVDHLGATHNFVGFEQLMFLPNQLSQFMLQEDVDVATQTVIGPSASRPLVLETPMMITGMTYGVISQGAKLALARASTLAGTSANSGEGGMVLEERNLASRYVLQYNRGSFSNTEEHLKLADMIEIKWGQGSNPGVPSVLPASQMDEALRQVRDLQPGQDSYMPAHHPHIETTESLKAVVSQLRQITDAPISLKFAASRIREDIDVALEAGVDAIVLDGAQGGTGASMMLTENSFGVPTMPAVSIAADQLSKRNATHVSLIATGGFRSPGDVMKALALGADAVYMGTVFLLAMTLNQIGQRNSEQWPDQAMQLVHYNVPENAQFNIDFGAQLLANYINACTQEIRRACRLLGITDVHLLSRSHMYTFSEQVAKLTGVATITDL